MLDCKGELLRDCGGLLERMGYEIKVVDLLNMEKSHCYNPFAYLKNDNDVQKMVTNLFKSTTPKREPVKRPPSGTRRPVCSSWRWFSISIMKRRRMKKTSR